MTKPDKNYTGFCTKEKYWGSSRIFPLLYTKLLLQNEVNLLPYIVDKAFEKGMSIALNPSPYDAALDAVDLQKIGIFILNEVEGHQITGKQEPDEIIAAMRQMFPHARIMLTPERMARYMRIMSAPCFSPFSPSKRWTPLRQATPLPDIS